MFLRGPAEPGVASVARAPLRQSHGASTGVNKRRDRPTAKLVVIAGNIDHLGVTY